MIVAGKTRLAAAMLADHPALGGWYLRNRLRTMTLALERSHLAGFSRFARGITLKPTLACNLRCRMCRFARNGDVSSGPGETLPLTVWVSLVDEVSRFSPYISLTGGEPLIYPHTAALIRHIRRRRMRCTLTTNGTLLAQRADVLMGAPPDMLIVSLDGPRDVHNSVRGDANAFDRTVQGLATVQEIKHQRGQRDPLLVINATITPHNYWCVDAVMDIARELKVSAVNFQHQWSLTPRMVDEHNAIHGDWHEVSCDGVGAADPPSVDARHMVETVARIRRRAGALGDEMVVTFHPDLSDGEVHAWYADPQAWVQRRTAVCAWINTNILPGGDVEACPGAVCGNITKRRFSQIWNDWPYRAFRRRLADVGDFPICVRCCAYFRRD